MEGTLSRTDIARGARVALQTLSDWVHRYNVERPGGLKDRPRSGRPTRLDEAK